MQEIRKAYVQDVKENYSSNNSIPQSAEKSTVSAKKSSDRLAISDDEIANYKNVYGDNSNETIDEVIDELDTSGNVKKEKDI